MSADKANTKEMLLPYPRLSASIRVQWFFPLVHPLLSVSFSVFIRG